jgi:hypothetical protein
VQRWLISPLRDCVAKLGQQRLAGYRLLDLSALVLNSADWLEHRTPTSIGLTSDPTQGTPPISLR